jgi:hypothetical protein
LRTSAPPSVPSPDHPSRNRHRNVGGEPHRREPAASTCQLLRAWTMPRSETSAPTTKITTAR